MEIQNAYKQKMAAQLKEWGAQIDLMEAKIANVSADVEVKRANELNELREKLDLASKKMSEYERTTGAAWDEIKITADVIWEDIKAGLAAAHLKFK
jgi:recombinational DNA repair ATPase RecF